jgi:hypothetical protein
MPAGKDDGAPGAAEPAGAPAEPVGTGDYVVVSGDGIGSIAEAHGHFWSTLWASPENAELKRIRANPNILLPGDRVTVPPLRPREETCATGLRHRFRRRGVPSKIHYELRDRSGRPFANKRYTLAIDGQRREGTTDAEGRISAWINAGARSGELVVELAEPGYPKAVRYKLRIGELEPIESIRGVQARLNGLGFYCGEEAGSAGEALTLALRAFQRAQNLEVTGTLDDATRAELRKAYGN